MFLHLFKFVIVWMVEFCEQTVNVAGRIPTTVIEKKRSYEVFKHMKKKTYALEMNSVTNSGGT